jgi:hypothetical protein
LDGWRAQPREVVYDIDGDGRPDDILTVERMTSKGARDVRLWIYRGRSDGRFSRPRTATILRENRSRVTDLGKVSLSGDVVVAHVGKNRPPDIVAGSFPRTAHGRLITDDGRILTGLGGMRWTVGKRAPNLGVRRPVSADVSGDGQAETILAFPAEGGITGKPVVDPVFDGTTGRMTEQQLPQLSAFADFNGDGRADAAYVDTRGQLWVRPGEKNDTFGRQVPAMSGLVARAWDARNPQGFPKPFPTDINGDGKMDLVIQLPSIRGSTSPPEGVRIRVFTGDGRGHFTAVGPDYYPTNFEYVEAVTDLDGDGHPDLVAHNGYVAWGSNGGGFG